MTHYLSLGVEDFELDNCPHWKVVKEHLQRCKTLCKSRQEPVCRVKIEGYGYTEKWFSVEDAPEFYAAAEYLITRARRRYSHFPLPYYMLNPHVHSTHFQRDRGRIDTKMLPYDSAHITDSDSE